MGLEDLFYVKKALGRDGELIEVYKFRTMYPESHLRLEETIGTNGLDSLGKPVKDLRIIPGREWMRKYWVDELPQLVYNVIIKKNMSLVGVRPKEENYWSLLPESLKKHALNYKPGFFGVHYARPNKDFQDLLKTESDYLDQKDQHPRLTDFKYFFLIIYNILFKGMRSR